MSKHGLITTMAACQITKRYMLRGKCVVAGAAMQWLEMSLINSYGF